MSSSAVPFSILFDSLPLTTLWPLRLTRSDCCRPVHFTITSSVFSRRLFVAAVVVELEQSHPEAVETMVAKSPLKIVADGSVHFPRVGTVWKPHTEDPAPVWTRKICCPEKSLLSFERSDKFCHNITHAAHTRVRQPSQSTTVWCSGRYSDFGYVDVYVATNVPRVAGNRSRACCCGANWPCGSPIPSLCAHGAGAKP
eukprot:SAG31_NODE_305_length_18002_cov_7.242808_2_plen_198_part_00